MNTKLLRALVMLSISFSVSVAAAQASRSRSSIASSNLGVRSYTHAKSTHSEEQLRIVVGQSRILSGRLIRRIYVADPAILQTYSSEPDELVLTAKAPGSTTLIVWDSAGNSVIYDVLADFNPSILRNALDSEFPGNHIEVQGGPQLLTLTGSVPTQAIAEAAGKLAASYARTVANSLRVVPVSPKQVELKLQILEVDRSKLEQFGFNLFSVGGNNLGSLSTQQFSSTATTSSAAGGSGSTISISNPLNFYFYNVKTNLGVTVQDLEQKNIAQILAEPTLTAVSGEEAKFLSGGQFPFPVVQAGAGNGTAITIQFRQYGVQMDFTPFVNDDGTIRVKVKPEVSALDYTNAVTISGYTIPALSTRSAETEVVLRDGQSFAISGLLDHRTTEVLSKIPGIGDIPILGQLFRSRNINHSVVELVVIIRARIVDPLAQAADVHQPALAVPNMNQRDFDKALHRERPGDVPSQPNPRQP